MKIIHCIYSFTMGGAETMLTDIVNRQCACGDDVTIIIVNDLIDEGMLSLVDSRVKVVRLGRKPGSRSPLPFVRLGLMLRRHPRAVIHCQSLHLLPTLPGLKKRLVYTVHDVGFSDRWHGRCGAIAAISHEVGAELEGKGWPVTVIPNGIDFDAIDRRPWSPPRPGEPVKIINVGRLQSNKKGQDILIRAAAMLRDRGIDTEVYLIGEGPSADRLGRLAGELGIGDSVKFLGRRDRAYVYSHLSQFHMMVHPSLYEGFGLTVAEGIAAGLPVVVSDSGGPYEIIARGKYGHPFRTGDAADCARAIADTITGYPSEADLDQARTHARNLYSLDRMVADYSNLYRQLTGACPSRSMD